MDNPITSGEKRELEKPEKATFYTTYTKMYELRTELCLSARIVLLVNQQAE